MIPTNMPQRLEGMMRNEPSPEGEALGAELARLTESELVKLREKFPNHKEPCGTCAFRRGTYPNRCVATVGDALKCVIEQTDFMCHETGSLCCGFAIALRAVRDKPPGKTPWDYSLSPDQIEQLEK
jgi:hypothetical protein